MCLTYHVHNMTKLTILSTSRTWVRRFVNMNKKLHKQRVKRLRKLKGNYFSVYFGSTRRLNQLTFALKEAGFKVINNNWDAQNHLICYKDGDASTHTHAGTGKDGMKATVVV